ncbi:MAG: hypothetical protein IPO62_01365 [Saprospiraceae bacterium]|nr:hypothetical protein [Saprospiraceae bacterium]MBK9629711.1 hypothetical protein [Saprospiraceae bacterium]
MNPALLFVSLLFFQNISFTDSLSLPHEHWHLLAHVKTSIGETKMEIQLQSEKGVFTGLQFRTKEIEFYIEKCELIFSDGTSLEFKIEQNISRNNRSKNLELKSNYKMIEKLNVWYTLPIKSTRAASIELYGKH